MSTTRVTRATTPFEGQKPGTSGLRKPTSVASQANYIENFVQATFNALNGEHVGQTLVASGDGRYLNKDAMKKIIQMSEANGVSKLLVAVDYLASTPAVSFVIRERKAAGGFILTASHNPGGLKGDFGIKYNTSNGGPAPDNVTNAIYQQTLAISSYEINETEVNIDVSQPGVHTYGALQIEVISFTTEYARMCRDIFDFPLLKTFIARSDFTLLFDGLHGVGGPFARAILVDELKAPESCLQNAVPLEDFGGGHPDPNLTYASQLVDAMGMYVCMYTCIIITFAITLDTAPSNLPDNPNIT